MPKTIEIVVSPDGATKLTTKGFAGTSCLTASRFLEEALGRTIADEATPERFQVEPSKLHEREDA